MALNDPLDGCESNARSGKLALRVEALESHKQLFAISGIETDSVIFDEEHVALGSDLDLRHFGRSAEFDGISNQIVEDDADQLWVGIRGHARLHIHLEVCSITPLEYVFDRQTRQLGNVDGMACNLLPSDAR